MTDTTPDTDKELESETDATLETGHTPAALAGVASDHQRKMLRSPLGISTRVGPYDDGAWYLRLFNIRGQRSRMTFNISREPFIGGNRRVNITLLNVRAEDRAKVSFKLNADKKWRADKRRTPHFKHGSRGVSVGSGTSRDRGYYVSDLRGMTRKDFVQRNRNAVIRIQPVPALPDLRASARRRLGHLPGDYITPPPLPSLSLSYEVWVVGTSPPRINLTARGQHNEPAGGQGRTSFTTTVSRQLAPGPGTTPGRRQFVPFPKQDGLKAGNWTVTVDRNEIVASALQCQFFVPQSGAARVIGWNNQIGQQVCR